MKNNKIKKMHKQAFSVSQNLHSTKPDFKIKEILKEQLAIIKPSKIELAEIGKRTKEVIDAINVNIKKQKLSASVFVGGSSAKGTLIKKDKYDIDLFVRFDKKYDDKEISKLLGKIIPKNSMRVHGSRDYFSLKQKDSNAAFEIIPVLNIKKPSEAKNITDLSYFHVNYIKNKISKNKRLADDIMLAKAILHFSDCYGAESYINGFSGYAVELLIVAFGSFAKFIEAIAKTDVKKEKIILDPAKLYKNKTQILQEMNESKLKSPIILIDPTFKERNALAALSTDTFLRFQEVCKKFLASPSNKFFIAKDKEALFEQKHKNKTINLVISTDKQGGDIAGTKLKKFYGFFLREADRYLDISAFDFVYDEDSNKGKIMLVAVPKKQIVFSGPPITMKEPLAKFKKEHRNIKIIKGKAFAYEKSVSFDKFLSDFMNSMSKFIEEMDVTGIEVA